MPTVLSQLQAAGKQEIMVFAPYYPQANRKDVLPYALSLYRSGNLEGERAIDGGENVPFAATWNAESIPAGLSRCQIQFNSDPELTYDMNMPAFEFVGYLIDLLIQHKRNQQIDFPQEFYRKLLNVQEDRK